MLSNLVLSVYCLCIIAASLGGGFLPWLWKPTHRGMQLVMSLVGGLMLGVAMLHLLPHSVAEQHGAEHSLDLTVGWMLTGLLVMFLLIRVFHVHAHEHGDVQGHAHDHDHPVEEAHAVDSRAHEHCHHDHSHDHSPASHSFSWLGLAFGLALHTIIDGLALGAAVAAEAEHAPPGFALFGLGTFLAVVLHKPLDALSITSLMTAGGWSRKSTFSANLVFALMCPLGALGFVYGLDAIAADHAPIMGAALAFAAGVFLCISLADLLPEVTFHSHDRLRLTAALFAGVGLAVAIGFLEP